VLYADRLVRSRLPSAFLLAVSLAACSPTPPRPLLPPPLPPRAPDWSAPVPPAAPAAPPSVSRRVEITLTPARDAAGEVATLDVGLRFSEPPGDFGDASPLVLLLEAVHEGDPGWPEAVEEVYARDAEGALSLKQKAVTIDGEAEVEWRSDRHPVGAINVSYRVRVPKPEGAFFSGLRAHAGGFQGTGSTFLLLPDTPDVYTAKITWNLDALGDESSAISSFGAGDVDTAGPLALIENAVFMAGPLGQLAIDHGPTHFRGAWLGRPGFDPAEAMAWAAHVRDVERGFFKDADTSTFTFFLRAVPGPLPGWVGTGRTEGFLFLPGEALGWTRKARFAIAHELVHHWIGGAVCGVRFEGPPGSAYWFTEGFTVHFTRELLLRSGLCTPDEYADDLRERTERFLKNPARGAPNDEIVKSFWTSHDFEHLPYDRGMLYAAEVDAAVRAKSGGKRSLDDLLLDLLDQARALGKAAAEVPKGEGMKTDSPSATAKLPASTWRDRVGAELGPDAQARFDAVILRGEAPAPPADAFGPCFKGVKKKLAVPKGSPAVEGVIWARDPKVPDASCARGGVGLR
jgi:predicted metalloprotease with PDZ domain